MENKKSFPRGRHIWAIAFISGIAVIATWILPGIAPTAVARAWTGSSLAVPSIESVLSDRSAIAMGEAPDRAANDVSPEVDGLPAIDSSADFVPGQILVKYRDGAQAEALTQSLLSERARLVQPPSSSNSPALIQLNDLDGLSPEAAKEKTLDAIAELEASEDVIYAEPNFVYSIQ